MLMVAEKCFRRLKAPALTKDVWLGAQYVGGLRIQTTEEVAARCYLPYILTVATSLRHVMDLLPKAAPPAFEVAVCRPSLGLARPAGNGNTTRLRLAAGP